MNAHTATGAGATIALIDSGINAAHAHVGRVAGGVTLSRARDGHIHQAADYRDELGHGTALAGVVRAKAPQAELYAIKIFARSLSGSIDLLEAGLRWAIERNLKVINLSLGTTNPDHRARLAAVVAAAREKNCLLIASSPPDRDDVLPAVLPGVLAVAGDEQCAWNAYRYVPQSAIPFRAHPYPRPLPGLSRERNFRGHSFASAHVAALLALAVEAKPKLGFESARTLLQQTAYRAD